MNLLIIINNFGGGRMRVVVCPDSFKGSLSAIQVANIIANAFHEVDDSIIVECVPIADGGEGQWMLFMRVLVARYESSLSIIQ